MVAYLWCWQVLSSLPYGGRLQRVCVDGDVRGDGDVRVGGDVSGDGDMRGDGGVCGDGDVRGDGDVAFVLSCLHVTDMHVEGEHVLSMALCSFTFQ